MSVNFDYTKPHKVVNGSPVLLTLEEIAADQEKDSAWVAGTPDRLKSMNQMMISQIEKESGLSRPVRDLLLATSSINEVAKAKVQEIEDQIIALGIRGS